MPPGNVRTKATTKVVEKASIEACITIARRVQRVCQQSGDAPGSEAAGQVVALIRSELLHDGGA